jgi:hypothetical protein
LPKVLAACVLLTVATAAQAQNLEIGTAVSAACLGSDGSVCGNGTHPLLAARASWWVSDRVELTARFGRTSLPSRQFTQSFPVPVEVSIKDRSRNFFSGLFTYHFRPGTEVGPMVGVGSGAFADVDRVECRPVDCAPGTGLPPGGEHRRWRTDVIFLLGLTGIIGENWVWRGGLMTHAFANDHNSTIETFAGIGYRFGL